MLTKLDKPKCLCCSLCSILGAVRWVLTCRVLLQNVTVCSSGSVGKPWCRLSVQLFASVFRRLFDTKSWDSLVVWWWPFSWVSAEIVTRMLGGAGGNCISRSSSSDWVCWGHIAVSCLSLGTLKHSGSFTHLEELNSWHPISFFMLQKESSSATKS